MINDVTWQMEPSILHFILVVLVTYYHIIVSHLIHA